MEIEKIVHSDSLIIYQVTREEIEAHDQEGVLELFATLKQYGRAVRGRVAIIFDGYNHLPQEIFEIPDIREWVAGLLQKMPYCLYCLTPIENNLQVLVACASDVRAIKEPASTMYTLNIEIPEKLYAHLIEGLRRYTHTIGDPGYLAQFKTFFNQNQSLS